jgi:hypothetical protein
MHCPWPELRTSACAIVHTVEDERALTGEYAGKGPEGGAPRPVGRAVSVAENDLPLNSKRRSEVGMPFISEVTDTDVKVLLTPESTPLGVLQPG